MQIPIRNRTLLTLFFFFLVGLCEIGGRYLVWLSIREKFALGIFGIVLFEYGMIPTLQQADFGCVYAAFGRICIVSLII
ncbi:hypothetical protein NTE_03522 [Candidatus Nitrososphaera evergladensis SR1]|uniref:Uncharacterized protein n=1 Tax=Candidatus Nitrososphaera evergladensis SR1 TaxID=1459636 RepID=A0A075MWC4_9ARCH|nr:hypothetical protein NTE_03522 [Candidatus Nitrososphaera evergladensis SR1]